MRNLDSLPTACQKTGPLPYKLSNMQDSWLRKKADEIQSFADRKDIKKFFDALKTVYGPQRSGTTPLLSADGTSLLTDKVAILKRWAEHFDGILSRPSSINDEAINRLPQVECNPLLDELPTVSETVKVIKLLTSNDQVARQDSRHRSPEKGWDAERTYSSEIGTVKMDRPCYQNA